MPKTQTAKVLAHLFTRGSLTNVEAQAIYRIRQLPARIFDLKRKGHKIVTDIRSDPTGQRYARYSLEDHRV
jgi:hypothetical protein